MSPIVRATAPLAADSLRAALSTFLAAFIGLVIFSVLTKPAASTGEWVGLAALLAAGLSAFAGFVRRPDAERRVLSAVLDNMIEAIAVHDRESRLVAWNRRYAELFKLPDSLLATHPSMFEIVRHQIRSGEHPNLPGETEDEKVKARMKQVPPPNTSFTFERKRPDGSWIEVRGIPLPGGGFVRTYVDTTERKHAEEAQAEQLELMDQIMRNVDQGIVVIDAEDRMAGFNRRYSELLELPEEYLRTKPSLQQTSKLLADRGEFQGLPTPVDSPADWQAMLAQPVTHGLPKVYRRRRPNGTVLEFRNTALPGGGSVRTITDVTERVRSEEAIRASEKMLHAVIDAIPIMVNLKDRDRRYLVVNRATTELAGVQARELLGRTAWPGREAENVSLTANRDVVAITTGEPQVYREQAGTDEGGRPRHWVTSKTPIKDDDGNVTHVVTASYDITDLVRADESVRASERQLSAILDAIPISVVLKDRDRRYLMMNRATEKMFGVNAKDIIGQTVWPGRTAEQSEQAAERDVQAITTGHQMVYEENITGKDRDGRPIYWMTAKTAIKDDTGQITHIVSTSYDVTEQRRAAEAVRESEQLLQAVIDAVPVTISVKDRGSRYRMINRYMADLFGFEVTDVIGMTGWDNQADEHSARSQIRDREVLATGQTVGFYEETLIDAQGRRREWLTTKVPIIGDLGEVSHIVTAGYEVSDLKRAEREVREREQQIRSLLESSPIGVTMTRRDGSLKFWNARYLEYVNRLTTKPIEKIDVRDFYRNPGDREAVIAELKQNGKVRDIEIECVDMQGDPLWVSSSLDQIDFEGERVTLGWFYEVTELKEAERRLRESEHRLRTILESSPIAVSISTEAGRSVFRNQSIFDLYGYSADETLGGNTSDFYLYPSDRARLIDELHRTGRVSGAEVPLKRRDGSIFWVLVFWQPLEVDGEPGIVAWLVDQTERRRAADELSSKTAVLEAVLENMDQGITMYDSDLRVVAWNRKFSELIDLPPEFLASNPNHADIIRRSGPAEVGVEGEELDRLALEHAARLRATTQPRISVRRRPNGMMLETRTTPVAGGGFVRTYTDVTEIKAAERKVAESELRLRTILESSPVGVGISQLDGTRIFTNRAFGELYGLSPDEVMSTNAIDFYVFPDERATLIERLRRDRQVSGVEVLQRRKDGTPFWCLSFWQEIDLGSETCTVVWTLDQTERKHQAQELAHQTEILTATLENMDQGIAMFDAEHRMVAWNRLFAEGVHLPPEFFDGKKTYDDIIRQLGPTEYGLKTKEQIDEYIRRHREHIAGLKSSHLSTHHRPDGEYIDIRTSPMPGGGFVRTYTNVTELKLAEQRLRESETRLRSLLESSPLAVSLQTFSGKRLFTNEAFADLYGFSRDGSLEADPRDYYVNPDDRVGLIERMKSEERIPGVEIEFRRADGSRFWAYMLWQRLTIDGEDSFVTWAYDVTERRRYQEALTKTRDAAEQASRAKSSFLATMSHEIRTPMNGVLGLLELLQQSQLSAEQQEMAAVIGESASSLLKIIDDILDFSKIEAGKLEVEQVPLALLTLVEGVAETLAAAARKKALAMVTFVDPDVPDLVRGDPVRLRQILFNLIGNAIKFTDKGQVTIETVPAPGRPGTILFKIIDTGIGLTPEGKTRLFQAFMQADDSTTRKFGGTGLGLSICKRLAENMGGDISVESEFGVGSTFTVMLPLPTEPAETRQKRQLDGVSVLVVEDDPTMRTVLARYLGAEGAHVEWVDSAEAALSRLRGRGAKVDVLVVDYKLPGIDGFALRQQVAESRTLATIGMVLVTAYDDRGQRRRALEAGFKSYLTKPVRRAVLLRAVEIALGRADGDESAADEAPVDRGAPADRNLALAEGRLILVAEDNPTNQMLVRRQLERLGYAADIVVDGRQGIDAYASVPYGMVITDCHMPVMDGFELTQKIRDLEHLTGRPRVPIVALTANVLQGEAERCLAAGMDDYLGKPVRLGRLAETIQRWLPKAAAATVAGDHAEGMGARALAANAPIDTAHLIEMFGEIDDVARATLATFLGSSRELVRAVIAQLATGDLASAGKSAHSIKGAARSAGAFPLAEIASGIEQAAKSDDLSEARQLSTGLAAELARVEAEVKRI